MKLVIFSNTVFIFQYFDIIGLIFLVPVYSGCPGKEAVKWVSVCLPIKEYIVLLMVLGGSECDCVIWLSVAGEVKDRHVVILDDLVQTGGTLIECAKASSSAVYFSSKSCHINLLFFMAALWNRAGHYIFALWFLSIYLSFLSVFFSSPNLSGRRLDVYHTSTHGVALVRI